MRTTRKTALLFILLFGCVGCDQVSKDLARHYLFDAGTLHLLGDTLRLRYAENAGGFLSLGAAIPDQLRTWIFIGSVGAMLLALLLYLFFANRLQRATVLALTLVLAGGLGNLLDRIMNHGRVVDFLNIGIGPLRTGIFNVADIAITVGGVLLAWRALADARRDDSPAGCL